MVLCTLLPAASAAQDATRGPERAAQTAAEAASAEAAGKLPQAMRLYERAYWEHADALYIYRRILLYERMGRHAEGLALLEGNRADLASSDQITDLALVEQRLRDGAQRVAPTPDSDALGWTLVGVGGAVIIAGGVSLFLAADEAHERGCTVSSSEPSASCDSISIAWTRQQFEDSQARETRLRGLGIAGVLLGAGALGVGLWQLMDDGEEPSAWRMEIAPTPGGAAVQLGLEF
jgi:hypothetical protein